MTKYIAYYRVSTKGQGQSGLGMEAQRAAVAAYVKDNKVILAEFQDIESGKKDNRPELMKAIAIAKEKGAKLIIAKLDRLSRNLTFISSLMDNKVSFVCCDMPEANEFTLHIFAALAQQERKMISDRTRRALEEKKKTGVKLGSPANLTYEHRLKGGKVKREEAKQNENNKRAAALIKSYRNAGMNWLTIANALNNAGFKTSRGKSFQAVQVQRIYNILTK